MNLIVRVKRRRSQEPSESLWIVDDAGPTKKKSTTRHLTESLNNLSTTNDDNKLASSQQRLFLRRIQTVEVGGEADLDKSALSASVSVSQKREREEDIGDPNKPNNPEESVVSSRDVAGSSMWITNAKKVLRSNYTLEKFVVVDVTQIPYSRPLLTSGIVHLAPSGKTESVKKSIVIDPATRKLDAAIETAFTSNNFNDMAQALQIGANINHQRRFDGLTALMVAAMCKNNRMVSRLISKGADVFLRDLKGKTALDYIKKDHNQSHTGNSHLQNASMEISLLLHKTAVKAQQLADRRKQRSDEEEETMRLGLGVNLGANLNPNIGDNNISIGSTSSMINMNNDGSVDSGFKSVLLNDPNPNPNKTSEAFDTNDSNEIIETDPNPDLNPNPNDISELNKATNETIIKNEDDKDYVVDIFLRRVEVIDPTGGGLGEIDGEEFTPVVQVEGLLIGQNGNVELIFQYDSDWSDLADDEDPDSNDERYFGNDYPEEEGAEVGEEEDSDDEG
jgi:hypothetical protein